MSAVGCLLFVVIRWSSLCAGCCMLLYVVCCPLFRIDCCCSLVLFIVVCCCRVLYGMCCLLFAGLWYVYSLCVVCRLLSAVTCAMLVVCFLGLIGWHALLFDGLCGLVCDWLLVLFVFC